MLILKLVTWMLYYKDRLILTKDLKWDRNTTEIVKNVNQRMQIFHSATKFTRNISSLKDIYTKFVRSKLETSSSVWHSSLTEKNNNSLERCQRSAFKIILKKKYISYENACEQLNMDTLYDRRELKCLRMAKGCLTERNMKSMFPVNKNRKNHERFKVNHARTSRYKSSAIIHMQRLLNKDIEENRKIKRSIDRACSREERLHSSVVYLCDNKNHK